MTIESFAEFGLADPLLRALARAGFDRPTPIQQKAIGPMMAGRDVLGVAQTGTGKTAAFGLPILHQILALPGRPAPRTARALVLAPTRELAVQIQDNIRAFAGGAKISTALVLGGVSRAAQIKAMARGVDVLVATPGRLTDLVGERRIDLGETRWVVLDEADRMLDMGFVVPVRKLLKQLHPRRQSSLYSATMPPEVARLAEEFLSDPLRVEAAPQDQVALKIDEQVEILPKAAKRARLAEILAAADATRVIVFARTKRGADRVAKNLRTDGVEADAIHGDKSQNARQRALNAFKSGRTPVLVATDLAARGIDVEAISHVVNFDLPDEAESYVHRIGRTARNGAAGVAITLCDPEERDKLRAVEKLTGKRLDPEAPAGRPAPRQGPGKPSGAPPRNRRRRRGPSRQAA